MSPNMVLPPRLLKSEAIAPIYNTGRRSMARIPLRPDERRGAIMIRAFRLTAVLILLLVTACVPTQRGPLVSGALPPQPPETARLIFYRTLEFYDSFAMTPVYLNGVTTGVSQNGAALYRD